MIKQVAHKQKNKLVQKHRLQGASRPCWDTIYPPICTSFISYNSIYQLHHPSTSIVPVHHLQLLLLTSGPQRTTQWAREAILQPNGYVIIIELIQSPFTHWWK